MRAAASEGKESKLFEWTPKFAYVIGLLATDGNLSPDGRHIDITSKDKEQLENFLHCLDLKVKIGTKYSGSGNTCFRVQFGNKKLYDFLLSIGIRPQKSKTIGAVTVPEQFFFDFLRGHFDGDGTFYSYFDPRWKSSFMFYTTFASASEKHTKWIRDKIFSHLGIRGHISKAKTNSAYQLRYAKRESLQLLPELYYNGNVVCLSRKRLKIERVLHNARVAKLADAPP